MSENARDKTPHLTEHQQRLATPELLHPGSPRSKGQGNGSLPKLVHYEEYFIVGVPSQGASIEYPIASSWEVSDKLRTESVKTGTKSDSKKDLEPSSANESQTGKSESQHGQSTRSPNGDPSQALETTHDASSCSEPSNFRFFICKKGSLFRWRGTHLIGQWYELVEAEAGFVLLKVDWQNLSHPQMILHRLLKFDRDDSLAFVKGGERVVLHATLINYSNFEGSLKILKFAGLLCLSYVVGLVIFRYLRRGNVFDSVFDLLILYFPHYTESIMFFMLAELMVTVYKLVNVQYQYWRGSLDIKRRKEKQEALVRSFRASSPVEHLEIECIANMIEELCQFHLVPRDLVDTFVTHLRETPEDETKAVQLFLIPLCCDLRSEHPKFGEYLLDDNEVRMMLWLSYYRLLKGTDSDQFVRIKDSMWAIFAFLEERTGKDRKALNWRSNVAREAGEGADALSVLFMALAIYTLFFPDKFYCLKRALNFTFALFVCSLAMIKHTLFPKSSWFS